MSVSMEVHTWARKLIIIVGKYTDNQLITIEPVTENSVQRFTFLCITVFECCPSTKKYGGIGLHATAIMESFSLLLLVSLLSLGEMKLSLMLMVC